ncbi:MAG: OmpH family outer membrane protein [Bacteroidetes bacterium]|nr:OmpH family outer membrane protein [Bacteroidota bacterium]
MKNFSTILNAVLLAAVAVLYYLHFKSSPEPVQTMPAGAFRNANIAFVNSDSMLDQYNYFKNKKAEFEEKQAKAKSELKEEGARLQGEIQTYQQKAGSMTEQQRQKTEELLTMKQQKFMQKKDEMLGQLDEEQSKSNEELYGKLIAFMKTYNKTRNYNFILGLQKGGGILFANDSLNITKDVVAGLNKEYEKEQKEK